MKKYNILFAVTVLVLASLACQTIMGGGNNDFQVPDATQTEDGGETPAVTPGATDGDGGVTVGGESEFLATSDAFNVVSTPETVTFQTKMNVDDVMKFYRDEFASQGYAEDSSMAIVFDKTFTMVFTGHASGKNIYVIGGDAGDGSIYITITLG